MKQSWALKPNNEKMMRRGQEKIVNAVETLMSSDPSKSLDNFNDNFLDALQAQHAQEEK